MTALIKNCTNWYAPFSGKSISICDRLLFCQLCLCALDETFRLATTLSLSFSPGFFHHKHIASVMNSVSHNLGLWHVTCKLYMWVILSFLKSTSSLRLRKHEVSSFKLTGQAIQMGGTTQVLPRWIHFTFVHGTLHRSFWGESTSPSFKELACKRVTASVSNDYIQSTTRCSMVVTNSF